MLCQAYTQVSFENEGLCSFALNCHDSLEGDVIVEKIPSMENLMDSFTKTLIGKVCVRMLYRHDALKASERMLG